MSNADQNTRTSNGRIKRPTIYDVVKLTGFSRGSVSRAFNNSPFINAATREKILKVASEIGYQPHAGARLIKTGRTRRWGVLLPNFANPYYGKLFEAFDVEAHRYETFLQLGLYHYDQKISDVLISCWSAGEVDGVIANSGAPSPGLITRMKKMGFPVLFIHSRPSDEFDMLLFERAQAVQHAIESLRMLGHRRVAYTGMINHNAKLNISYILWEKWMRENGMENPDELSCFVPNNSDAGVEAWKILRRKRDKFTAVLAYNDIIACGLIQSARAEKVRIPEDISIIGNDDIDEGRRLGLTTMRHDMRLAAILAIKQLEARRQGDNAPPAVLRVESQFIMRDSVAPARE